MFDLSLSYSGRIRIVLGTELKSPGTKLTLRKIAGCRRSYLHDGVPSYIRRKIKHSLLNSKKLEEFFLNINAHYPKKACKYRIYYYFKNSRDD